MDLELKDTHKKDQIQKERRKFLKKATYSAPKLMALGYLLSTSQATAACDPFADPNCNGVSGPVGFYDHKILKKKSDEERIV